MTGMIMRSGKLIDYMAQTMNAQKLVSEMMQYAQSIGVKFGEGACYDECFCTEEQSRLLADWWQAQVDSRRITTGKRP